MHFLTKARVCATQDRIIKESKTSNSQAIIAYCLCTEKRQYLFLQMQELRLEKTCSNQLQLQTF